MADNIDNLLDDLDALITNNPPHVNSDSSNNGAHNSMGSFPYKIPHRPSSEKSPTQLSNPNPKNKFAVSPSPNHSYNQHNQSRIQHHHHQQGFRSEHNHNQTQSSVDSSSNSKKDDIDTLLDELLDSPSKHHPPSSFHSSHSSSSASKQQPSHLTTACITSQYSSSSRSGSANGASSSSSAFPSFERVAHGDGSGSSYVSTSSKGHDTSKNYNTGSRSISGTSSSMCDDNSFDSLLSDLNSSLPPVSPNTKQNITDTSTSTVKHSSSFSASLLQQPPQSAGGSAKGGRCSRVVVAGSGMSRGAKTSAFAKSACDRLRCLKCNFEAIQFPGKAWTGAVDYMFFRNNMPNREKLSVELKDSAGSVAYCCQCSWISTEEEQTLSAGQPDKPQWVCAGH